MLSVLFNSNFRSFEKLNFGFGKRNRQVVFNRFGFNSNFSFNRFSFVGLKKVDSLFASRIDSVLKQELVVNNHSFNFGLQKQINKNVEILKSNRSWRGVRHLQNLPVRGQRTKTNARTRKVRRK